MKKTVTLLLVFIALLAVGASALQVTSGTIGGPDQDRLVNTSTTISVTNDGTSNLSSVVLSFAGDSKYNVRFEPATFSLGVGEAKTITVYGDIPLIFDAVIKTTSATDFLEESPYNIGTVTANAGSVQATAELNMQAANQLQIKKINAQCGDQSERLDDGERFENLEPDMQCSITVEVENTFDDNDRDDLLIAEIEFDPVYIEVESLDSDLDLDEDDDITVDAEEEDELTFDFDIEDDTAEGKYEVEVRVFGTDDNGAFHGEMWTIKFEVERLKHDIKIKGATINPVQMDNCQERRLNVDATLLNIGKRDEEEVVAQAVIADLTLEKKISNLELDTDDSERVSFTFEIPEGVESKIYTLELHTFFDTTALSNTKRFDFVVDKCSAEDTTVVDTTTTTDTTDVVDATGATTTARVRSSSASSFKESPAYMWLLAGVSVLLAVIVIVLLVVLFRRPLDEE